MEVERAPQQDNKPDLGDHCQDPWFLLWVLEIMMKKMEKATIDPSGRDIRGLWTWTSFSKNPIMNLFVNFDGFGYLTLQEFVFLDSF